MTARVRIEPTYGETKLAIWAGLRRYNNEHAGMRTARPVTVSLREKNEIVGGLTGTVNRSWLSIELLWLEETQRGKGFGAHILKMAEAEAKRLGATRARVDTFSFQAPGFYEKMGYKPFGVLEDHPPGHRTIYLSKIL